MNLVAAGVKRRVSALGSGLVDRSALAKSVLASRSLLDRGQDIDRLMEGLRVPFRTQLDDRSYRNTNCNLSDRNPAHTDTLSRYISFALTFIPHMY